MDFIYLPSKIIKKSRHHFKQDIITKDRHEIESIKSYKQPTLRRQNNEGFDCKKLTKFEVKI